MGSQQCGLMLLHRVESLVWSGCGNPVEVQAKISLLETLAQGTLAVANGGVRRLDTTCELQFAKWWFVVVVTLVLAALRWPCVVHLRVLALA